MVLLTMTTAIVEALELLTTLEDKDWDLDLHEDSPPLQAPAVGKPITHIQVIAVSKGLKKHLSDSIAQDQEVSKPASLCHLDSLLRGSNVYIEPPKPQPEPVRMKFGHCSQLFADSGAI